jgi:hypothetical protein
MFLKSINDITIQNGLITVSRNINSNSKKLFDQIKLLPYNGERQDKDNNIENTTFPPFIQVFYYHFFAFFKIPSEKEFIETYFNWLGGEKNGLISYDNNSYDAKKLSYRILRSYPSLIRDLHFLYLLEESKKFDKVLYSMHKDYFNGLDINIVYKGIEAYVSLFIDTGRANYFKKLKTKRHDYSEINEIEFSVSKTSLTKAGKFYLLNEQHIDQLINHLNDL